MKHYSWHFARCLRSMFLHWLDDMRGEIEGHKIEITSKVEGDPKKDNRYIWFVDINSVTHKVTVEPVFGEIFVAPKTFNELMKGTEDENCAG